MKGMAFFDHFRFVSISGVYLVPFDLALAAWHQAA